MSHITSGSEMVNQMMNIGGIVCRKCALELPCRGATVLEEVFVGLAAVPLVVALVETILLCSGCRVYNDQAYFGYCAQFSRNGRLFGYPVWLSRDRVSLQNTVWRDRVIANAAFLQNSCSGLPFPSKSSSVHPENREAVEQKKVKPGREAAHDVSVARRRNWESSRKGNL